MGLKEFEGCVDTIKQTQKKGPNLQHHEQVESIQKQFKKQLTELQTTIKEMGNPFLEQSEDLIILGTMDFVDEIVIERLNIIQGIGTKQYHKFVEDRLEKKTSTANRAHKIKQKSRKIMSEL